MPTSPSPSVKGPLPIIIRRATVEDASTLAALGSRTYAQTFPNDFGLAQTLEKRYTPSAVTNLLLSTEIRTFLACKENSPKEAVGFLELRYGEASIEPECISQRDA